MTDSEELQELLEVSYRHVVKQGKPSYDASEKECLYKFGDLGCAAAPFIKEYIPDMENIGWTLLAEEYPVRLNPLAVKHAEFVSGVLQRAHDRAAVHAGPDDFLADYKSCLDNGIAIWNHDHPDQTVRMPE